VSDPADVLKDLLDLEVELVMKLLECRRSIEALEGDA
jgi:hypothetical protein